MSFLSLNLIIWPELTDQSRSGSILFLFFTWVYCRGTNAPENVFPPILENSVTLHLIWQSQMWTQDALLGWLDHQKQVHLLPHQQVCLEGSILYFISIWKMEKFFSWDTPSKMHKNAFATLGPNLQFQLELKCCLSWACKLGNKVIWLFGRNPPGHPPTHHTALLKSRLGYHSQD